MVLYSITHSAFRCMFHVSYFIFSYVHIFCSCLMSIECLSICFFFLVLFRVFTSFCIYYSFSNRPISFRVNIFVSCSIFFLQYSPFLIPHQTLFISWFHHSPVGFSLQCFSPSLLSSILSRPFLLPCATSYKNHFPVVIRTFCFTVAVASPFCFTCFRIVSMESSDSLGLRMTALRGGVITVFVTQPDTH